MFFATVTRSIIVMYINVNSRKIIELVYFVTVQSAISLT